MKKYITVVSLVLLTLSASAQISDEQAIRAIVGEAANQTYAGKLAVASAIRNRGTLKGVYGLHAKHNQHESPATWEQARQAWLESATHGTVGKATHWDNIKVFGKPSWTKRMVLVAKVGDHWFYADPKKT